MKLATLYEAYSSMDFDLDIATESKVVLCDTHEQAVAWAESEIKEGRDPETKWEWAHTPEAGISILATECNEYGTEEESWLVVRDIKKIGE